MGSGSGSSRRGAAGRSRASVSTPKSRDAATGPSGGKSSGEPTWRGGNRILASLPAEELAVVSPALTPINLESGRILYQQWATIDAVYFPDTAVASLLSRMENGAVVEVGTIGNEGAVGISLFL